MAAKRKKSSLATITKRVATRKRAAKKKSKKGKPPAKKNPASVPNPPVIEDLTQFVLPGVGAYAASRIIGRIAYKVGKKKSPAMAKHAGALAPAAYLIAVWFLVHKVKRLEAYHAPALIGASIGALQSILQTYLPQYGWILNDYHLDDVLPNGSQAAIDAPTPAGQIETGHHEAAGHLEEGDLSDDDQILSEMGYDGMYSGSLSGGLGGLGG